MGDIKKLFDDIVTNIDGQWSQICENCRSNFNLVDCDDYTIDYHTGHGICGIKGCDNGADHYIDFK